MSRPVDKEAIDQVDVLRTVLGFEPVPRRLIRNPLREDNTPGAFFAWKGEKLRLQDYADKRTHGFDCWDIYMEMRNLPNLGAAIADYTGGQYIPSIGMDRWYAPRYEFRIRPEIIPFDSEGAAYWEDYGISVQELEADGVRQCGAIISSSILSDDFEVRIVPSDITFALPPIGGRNKIYRPTGPSKFKFRADMLDDQYWTIQEGETRARVAFIGSGYKDIRVAANEFVDQLDYFALAVSEAAVKAHQIGNNPIIQELQNYDGVIVGLDFDKPGYLAMGEWEMALDFGGIPNVLVRLRAEDGDPSDIAAAKKRHLQGTSDMYDSVIDHINQAIHELQKV